MDEPVSIRLKRLCDLFYTKKRIFADSAPLMDFRFGVRRNMSRCRQPFSVPPRPLLLLCDLYIVKLED